MFAAIFNTIGFLVNAGLSAMNVVLYASEGNPANLFAAVFCGACAIFFGLATAAVSS